VIGRCADLERFFRGEIDPGMFPHEQHVRMGFEILRRCDFAETVHLYSRALRAMAEPGHRHRTAHIRVAGCAHS
jgi:hypothetical protein